MKKLFRVTCCGTSGSKNPSIYVVAENPNEAENKALVKVRELKYNRIDSYVSEIILIADEKDSCKNLLVI